MTSDMTGPALFRNTAQLVEQADSWMNADMGWRGELSSEERIARRMADLAEAQIHATNAQTAAIVMLVNAMTNHVWELDAWRDVIPLPPLKECKGKENRRPECAERHTEDCKYAEPPPEPKHELLDIGARVLVSDWAWEEPDMFERGERKLRLKNPQPGRISGYDMHRSKYRWQREYEPGVYAKHDSWAFVDNRVEVHPDGPECPEPPR